MRLCYAMIRTYDPGGTLCEGHFWLALFVGLALDGDEVISKGCAHAAGSVKGSTLAGLSTSIRWIDSSVKPRRRILGRIDSRM